ncbi:MAG: FMN-binding protein [Bacteroidales bacterium]|nr:FMN-binding protein [Bacteroidales bacterium]
MNVTFKDDVIKNVEILENHETPDYLDCVEKEMLPKFIDLPIDEVDKIDGFSGATFTSKALRNNIKVAADYYKKNK